MVNSESFLQSLRANPNSFSNACANAKTLYGQGFARFLKCEVFDNEHHLYGYEKPPSPKGELESLVHNRFPFHLKN